MAYPKPWGAGDGWSNQRGGRAQMSLGWQIMTSPMRELCGAMREPRCFYTSSPAGPAAQMGLGPQMTTSAMRELCEPMREPRGSGLESFGEPSSGPEALSYRPGVFYYFRYWSQEKVEDVSALIILFVVNTGRKERES